MTISLYLLLFVMCAASFSDWRQRKIPNLLLLPSFLLALLINFLATGLHGLLYSLLGAIIGFLLLIVPYLFGGIGAGDVKLLIVIGSFGGLYVVFYGFILGAIAGGIISLLILIYNYTGKNKVSSLPYGIPLSLGTSLYIFSTHM